jgi:hypothetical protein
MQWIANYWYMIVLGLVTAMFFLGHRSHKGQDGNMHDNQHGTYGEGGAKKGGECCHWDFR